MEQEIWKYIILSDISYEWHYQASNLWRIKSLKYWKERMLILYYWNWYKRIRLGLEWKERQFSVHRIIAKLFLPNPDGKLYVNHINAVRCDNRVENLEWCTQKENIRHAWKMWLNKNNNFCTNHPMKWKFWNENIKSKSILQLSKEWEFIREWWSQREVKRGLGIAQSSISNCCQWKKMYAGGFIWKYKKHNVQ